MNSKLNYPETKYTINKRKGRIGVVVMEKGNVIQVIHPIFTVSAKNISRFSFEKVSNFRKEESDAELTLIKEYMMNYFSNHPLEPWVELEFSVHDNKDAISLKIKGMLKI